MNAPHRIDRQTAESAPITIKYKMRGHLFHSTDQVSRLDADLSPKPRFSSNLHLISAEKRMFLEK